MAEIRDRIVEGSRPMFARHGFRKLTMDQIAREMHISKRTIYEHFHSKDELVEEICESFVVNDWEQVRRQLDASRDCIDKLRSIFRVYDIDEFGAQVFRRGELDVLKTHFPTAWAKLYRLIELRRQAIGEIFREGVATGVFLEHYPAIPGVSDGLSTEKTIELITFFASALLDEVLASELTGYEIGLNTALQHACDMMIRAISVPGVLEARG